MYGKMVEIRLIIFRARTLQILTQISYYTLADFSSARSRVDGLHITPPPASNRGEAKETHGPRGKGGRPRRGAGAGEVGVFPRWGLRRSTETAVGEPPMSTTKYLMPGTRMR